MTHSKLPNNLENLSVWRADDLHQPVWQIETTPKEGSLYLSPDGKTISEVNGNNANCIGTYRLWSTQNNSQSVLYSGDSCWQQDYTFTPDSRWLLVGWDTSLDVVDVDAALQDKASTSNPIKGKSTVTMYLGDSLAQTNLIRIVFSPDGQIV